MAFRLRFVIVDLFPSRRSSMNENRCHKIATIVIALALSLICPAQADEKVANPKVLHVLNRLSYGPRPGDVAKVESIGIDRYIQQQLSPETIAESSEFGLKIAQFKSLKLTPLVLLKTYGDLQKSPSPMVNGDRNFATQISGEAMQANLLRSLESPRQLEAIMVNFWFNHFNVFVGKGRTRFLVGSYEDQAIRPHSLGRFRDLLGATAKHPAMLFYLDNWQNTAPNSPGAKGRSQGLNENYARELMELQTLGVNGGYSQQDVISLAKILTGWGIARPGQKNADPSGFYFDPRRHDAQAKVFLGQPIAASGQAEGEQALDILARHPKTARFISYKLSQYFVADEPPKPLVDRLSQVYLSSDGNIKSMLSELFKSPEFWSQTAMNSKLKTPYHYAISAVRATGLSVDNVQPLITAVQQMGMPIYGRQSPDGYPNTKTTWLNPDAITQRVSFATTLAQGNLFVAKQSDRAIQRNKQPISAIELRKTIGNRLSANTEAAIAQSPVNLQSALILGSPDFMWR
jgi:uncharacterized protein (DUF1800 family)